MAVLQMQHISICALKKNRKQILENLQRRGVVEVGDLPLQDSVFSAADTSASRAQFIKSAQSAAQALEVLNEYIPEKTSMLSSLEGRESVSVRDYEARAKESTKVLDSAQKLLSLSKRIAENKAEALKLATQLDALEPWMSLDVPLRFSGTKKTAAFIGSLAGEYTVEWLYERLAQEAPNATVSIDLVSHDQDMLCVFIVTPRSDADAVDSALRGLGFTYPPSPAADPPDLCKRKLLEQAKQVSELIADAEDEIRASEGLREKLKFTVDYFTMRAEKYEALGRLAQSRSTFMLSGYVPQRSASALESELNERFDVAVEISDPPEDADVPVILRNNPFSEPTETVVESYSLPGKGEIDPTTIMSFFYYFLFGMMLSDAGYGLIMVIACGIVIMKFKNMEPGMAKMVKMFFWCGVSTVFWGLMFGSFFGDAVAVISTTFFHSDLKLKALWFEPVAEPMRLLVFSFLVGIIHLFTGLGIKFYSLCKEGKFKDALYDVVFWYMLVGGGIFYLLSMSLITDMLGISFTLPPIAGTISACSAAIGAIGIILTSGRESRNPVKRLLKGLYGVYNVTGYLSDILSYSRLLALGLATGVIATVFNKMGSMGGDGFFGVILFIAVFLVGHALNIGINLLGAYVHTNRLQFVEFFGKFYEGGGRKFTPFAANTKYYKFKEEI